MLFRSLDNPVISAGMASYPAVVETLHRLKAAGFNGVYSHNYGCEPGSHLSYAETLRAADDVGMLFFFAQPHFQQYDWDAPDADTKNGYAGHAKYYVQAAQHHPSVVMYATSHNATSYEESTSPDMMDGIQNPRQSWSQHAADKAMRAEAIIRKLDPTRIVYHHSSGNLGSMHTDNFYMNFVPQQEMADWLGRWSEKGVKPLFLCELDRKSVV